MTATKRLQELNIELKTPPAPVANYVGFKVSGNQVIISGQIALNNGQLTKGRLGEDMTKEQGYDAAKVCAINVINQLNSATNNIDAAKCVKLGIFVNSTASFTDQPFVANGASDLMVEVFGENGKHARAAVGVNTLPLGSSVEIEAIFEI